MKASITFISYCPDVLRGETFRIGLIVRCDETGFYCAHISEHRAKRIAEAFGAENSVLLKETILTHSKQQFDDSYLSYLADYENGIVRYSKPQTIATDDPETTYKQLYVAYIQDPDEQQKIPLVKEERGNGKFHQILKKNTIIKSRFNVDFRLTPAMTGGLMTKSHKVDFIGKNHVVHVGQMPKLDDDKSIDRCLVIFNAIEKHFKKQGLYDAEKCMVIVLNASALTEEQSAGLETLRRWKQAEGYTLIEGATFEEITNAVAATAEKNNIHPFTPELFTT